MIVVADTSPLNYLVQIECDVLLSRLFGQIIVPAGVMRELRHPAAPESVRRWLARVPDWVKVVETSAPPDSQLEYLGRGEREAIQLCGELKADLLLIDERKGRQEARRRGFRTTGTLGVLLSAAELGIIDAEPKYRRLLTETSFRASPELEARFLDGIRSFRET
jgi:predicted nucleic acid-binding protein